MPMMNFIVIVRVAVALRLVDMLMRVGRLRLGRRVPVLMVVIVAMLMPVGQRGMFVFSLFHVVLLLWMI
jgi:hypothetical protein